MENCTYKIEGKKLTITVDLAKNLGPTSTAKNIMIAKSEGPETLAGTGLTNKVKLNLQIFRPITQEDVAGK